MNRKHEHAVPHQVAETVDNIADDIRAAAHTVGGSVQDAAHTVHVAASRTARAVEDKFQEAGQFARDSVKHGSAQARVWENRLQSCVRDNLLVSFLFAMGLGAVIALVWKHKRS